MRRILSFFVLIASAPFLVAGPFPFSFWGTAAVSAATATDNYNRASITTTMSDGVSTFTNGPGAMDAIQITGSTEATPSTASWCGMRVLAPAFAVNQSASVTEGAAASKQQIGVCVRMTGSGSGSGYMAYSDSTTQITIYKMTDSGSMGFAALGATYTVTALVASDIITLEATGTSTTTLVLKINGVTQTSGGSNRTDASSPYTSGQPGLIFVGTGTTNSITEFSATDL